jgi:hypothetical protein
LVPIAARLSFIVGVSSSPSATQSLGQDRELADLLYAGQARVGRLDLGRDLRAHGVVGGRGVGRDAVAGRERAAASGRG